MGLLPRSAEERAEFLEQERQAGRDRQAFRETSLTEAFERGRPRVVPCRTKQVRRAVDFFDTSSNWNILHTKMETFGVSM